MILQAVTIFAATLLAGSLSAAVIDLSHGSLVKQELKDLPNCEGRPEFITEVRPDIIGGVEKLPQVLLVARDAEYYVEAKSSQSDFRIHSYQSFTAVDLDDRSRIICANGRNIENSRFSLFAPTLIDTTPAQKTGQSLWQFQIYTDKDALSAWNKKSLAFPTSQNLEKTLEHMGGSYRIYQLAHDQYEIVVSKSENGITQYLSIRYDAVTPF